MPEYPDPLLLICRDGLRLGRLGDGAAAADSTERRDWLRVVRWFPRWAARPSVGVGSQPFGCRCKLWPYSVVQTLSSFTFLSRLGHSPSPRNPSKDPRCVLQLDMGVVCSPRLRLRCSSNPSHGAGPPAHFCLELLYWTFCYEFPATSPIIAISRRRSFVAGHQCPHAVVYACPGRLGPSNRTPAIGTGPSNLPTFPREARAPWNRGVPRYCMERQKCCPGVYRCCGSCVVIAFEIPHGLASHFYPPTPTHPKRG